MKTRTWLLSIVILAFITVLVGVGLCISSIDQQTAYHATGEVLVTPTQWEALKETFAQTDVNLANVQTLDNAGNLLVQFTDINVNSNFPYGTVTVTKGKALGSPAQTAEGVCIGVGFGVLVSFLVPLCVLWDALGEE